MRESESGACCTKENQRDVCRVVEELPDEYEEDRREKGEGRREKVLSIIFEQRRYIG